MTDAEKIKLLVDGLKQMLCAFDTPLARRRMPDKWSEDSRQFSRDIYERVTGSSIYAEATPK